LKRAEQLLADAVRPVVIVGLEAREKDAAAATRALVETLGCPVLTTYKAKGVIDDLHAQYVGVFTGGTAEVNCVGKADLIVLCGVDPVEFIRQPWNYTVPVIDIALVGHPVHYMTPAVGVYGSVAEHVSRLSMKDQGTDWSAAEIGGFRDDLRSRLQYRSTTDIGPQQVVELAVQESRSLEKMPRITVDAGAHMFSAMAFWPCAAPYDVLISNGLATMAFALPAAIAVALHQPDRRVIALTGDGGLLMCLGELSTAAQQKAGIAVIVFNDESLSLIDIKQRQRGLATRGVLWSRPDFAQTMVGLGGRGYRVENLKDYRMALTEALRGQGPALIDVSVDPSGYAEQLKAMRG
jgi:acetolactate synthase-1/2/3 large subunit